MVVSKSLYQLTVGTVAEKNKLLIESSDTIERVKKEKMVSLEKLTELMWKQCSLSTKEITEQFIQPSTISQTERVRGRIHKWRETARVYKVIKC